MTKSLYLSVMLAAGSAITRNALVRTGPNRWRFRSRVNGVTIEGYLTGSKRTIVTAYPVR